MSTIHVYKIEYPDGVMRIHAKAEDWEFPLMFHDLVTAASKLRMSGELFHEDNPQARLTYNFTPFYDIEWELHKAIKRCFPLTKEEQDVFWENFKNPPLLPPASQSKLM